MNHTNLSKSLATALAIAGALVLTLPNPGFAKKPGAPPVCVVGKAEYPTIQSAVDDFNCAAINIPAGTFYENVVIRRSVTIRGAGPGFTFVNGGGVERVLAVVGYFGEERIVAELKGMTITGGRATAAIFPPNGGGIEAADTDLTVKDCVVTGNAAPLGQGGGMAIFRGTLTVKDSLISNNSAMDGGGIRGRANVDLTNVVTIVDSVIVENVATRWGGGILSISGPLPPGGPAGAPGTLIVKDSIVTGNSAGILGGGIFYYNSTLTVTDSDISDNVPDDIFPPM